jgi:hypothetical protein
MPEPHLRAGDTDREAVAAALGTHMAAGRLTLAEYDDRLSRAYAATTFGELAALTADLPAPTPAVSRPVGSGPAPATAPRPAPTGFGAAAGRPGIAPLQPCAWRGLDQHSWRAWASTSVTVLVVYLVISLASWELSYFWPIWVIGPWGAALLLSRIGSDRARTDDDRPQLGR